MKTVKQIADEIGVDKQKVYRYIVRHGIHEVDFDSESGARNKTKYYDDQTVEEIMDAFHKSGASAAASAASGAEKQEETDSAEAETAKQEEDEEEEEEESSDFVSFLMQQVEEKDRQIFNLQKLLDQEQRLHLQTQAALDSASRRIAAIEEKEDAAEKAEASDVEAKDDPIPEVTPFEMKPVTPAPESEEEPVTVQTVSEVLAQNAAKREEEKAASEQEQAEEPIFHDTETQEEPEPPKKKGFWRRLFGM